ncbi:hypothetical protein P7K49_013735 [Saguinus oedipus]|uniref:Uncharacterized protein n=1 Tax=Saguinus oedipus TaxID=9490 RepID=A0ABQ9VHJ6_SAGOE|nr:hypothetical protein P7K49_013735 [Saguinus oedipus]
MVMFLIHINSNDLALESNPSDHPRASTIFLSKSQTDASKEEAASLKCVIVPGFLQLEARLLLTVGSYCKDLEAKPAFNLGDLKFVEVGICNRCLPDLIIGTTRAAFYNPFLKHLWESLHWVSHRAAHDTTLRQFMEFNSISAITREKVPEEYFKHDPEHKFIYRFVRTLFSAAQLTAECAIVTLHLRDKPPEGVKGGNPEDTTVIYSPNDLRLSCCFAQQPLGGSRDQQFFKLVPRKELAYHILTTEVRRLVNKKEPVIVVAVEVAFGEVNHVTNDVNQTAVVILLVAILAKDVTANNFETNYELYSCTNGTLKNEARVSSTSTSEALTFNPHPNPRNHK